MAPTVYVTYFSDKTEAEARIRFAADNLYCGHRCRTAIQPNDLILMVNHVSGYVVGVARAATTCLDSSFTELGYTAEDAKYNKYAILVKDLVLLKHRITLRALRSALGVDDEDKSRTNIYKGFPNSWQPAFIQNEALAPTVLSRLAGFIEGLLLA